MQVVLALVVVVVVVIGRCKDWFPVHCRSLVQPV